MFDEVIAEFPLALKYLAQDASILRYQDFENCIVLIQDGKGNDSNNNQRHFWKKIYNGLIRQKWNFIQQSNS